MGILIAQEIRERLNRESAGDVGEAGERESDSDSRKPQPSTITDDFYRPSIEHRLEIKPGRNRNGSPEADRD
jgi:hypothetical protein